MIQYDIDTRSTNIIQAYCTPFDHRHCIWRQLNQLPYAVRHPPIWKYVKHYIGNRNIVEVSSFFIDKIYVRYPDFINGFVVKFKDGNPTRVVRKTDISPSLTQKEAHGKILKLKAYCFMIPAHSKIQSSHQRFCKTGLY